MMALRSQALATARNRLGQINAARHADRASHAAEAGAALLAALLTVALVAVLATQAFWQQWQGIEVETASRARVQMQWLMSGTLDWARLRLPPGGPAGPNAEVDHLGQPWATPLNNVSLSEFLTRSSAASAAPPGTVSTPAPARLEATVSMRIVDAQSRLNVLNLLEGSTLSPVWLGAFSRLFDALGLPPTQLRIMTEQLRLAGAAVNESSTGGGRNVNNVVTEAPGTSGVAPAPSTTLKTAAPLLPQQASQLAWLGLDATTLAALAPHVTVLPDRVPVNINTASVEVLQAVVPGLARADALRLAATRQGTPFQSVTAVGLQGLVLPTGLVAVNSRYFEVHTELRLGQQRMAEHALLQREGTDVRTLWRKSVAVTEP